jgi:hypothetical protein
MKMWSNFFLGLILLGANSTQAQSGGFVGQTSATKAAIN